MKKDPVPIPPIKRRHDLRPPIYHKRNLADAMRIQNCIYSLTVIMPTVRKAAHPAPLGLKRI